MSCSYFFEELTERVGEFFKLQLNDVKNAVKNSVKKGTKCVTSTYKSLFNGLRFVAEKISEAYEALDEKKQIKDEVKRGIAGRNMESFRKLLSVNFNLVKHRTKESNSLELNYLNANNLKAIIHSCVEIAKELGERWELAFTEEAYNELAELNKIDFHLLDENKLKETAIKVNKLLEILNESEERGKAVIAALNGEHYREGIEFSETEIFKSCSEILKLYTEFEKVMGCYNGDDEVTDTVNVRIKPRVEDYVNVNDKAKEKSKI